MLIRTKPVCTNCGELVQLHNHGAEVDLDGQKQRGVVYVTIGDNKIKLCEKAPRPRMRRRKSFTTHPISRLSK